MPPDVLQYGALGVLLMVLVGGFTIAKNLFERMFEQSSENMKFVRDQIEKADAERAGQLKAWIDAYREQIQLNSTIAETMVEMLAILKRLNGHE